ncbi:MAG: hypothetical protein L3V56_00345 [Candidatus Magnetoovum sp. WYHC-5]|nr:hypothetical protein [Candidatus Magnetoovum sp. WYHC-5]
MYETYEYSFSSYQGHDIENIVDKGWFPYFMPHDATNIKIRYTIDDNIICVSFNYTKEGLKTIESACKLSQVQVERGLKLYSCSHNENEQKTSSALIDYKDNKAWYWTANATQAWCH